MSDIKPITDMKSVRFLHDSEPWLLPAARMRLLTHAHGLARARGDRRARIRLAMAYAGERWLVSSSVGHGTGPIAMRPSEPVTRRGSYAQRPWDDFQRNVDAYAEQLRRLYRADRWRVFFRRACDLLADEAHEKIVDEMAHAGWQRDLEDEVRTFHWANEGDPSPVYRQSDHAFPILAEIAMTQGVDVDLREKT